MGLKTTREKPRHYLASLLYRTLKFPLPTVTKFRLFLDLEWIFNRLASETAHRYYGPHNLPRRNDTIEYILSGIEPSDVVLDLGCGFGEIAAAVAKKAKKVVGVDHDKNKIVEASRRSELGNLDFFCTDAIEYLRNNEETFDVLILCHVLEHIDNPEDFTKSFLPYFKRVYVEVPDFDASIHNHYRNDLDLKLVYTDNDHVREFDRVELEELLRKSGLRIMNAQYIFGVQRYWCEVVGEQL